MRRLALRELGVRLVCLVSVLISAGCGATQNYPLDEKLSESGKRLLSKEGFAYDGDKRDVGRELYPYLRPDGKFQPVKGIQRPIGMHRSDEPENGETFLCLLSVFLYPCSIGWDTKLVHINSNGTQTSYQKRMRVSHMGFLVAPIALFTGWTVHFFDTEERNNDIKEEWQKTIITLINGTAEQGSPRVK